VSVKTRLGGGGGGGCGGGGGRGGGVGGGGGGGGGVVVGERGVVYRALSDFLRILEALH